MKIELLSSPRLVRDGSVIHPLERRDAALLALLAIDGPTTRARAAALLWPDSDAKRANISLRQRLFRLKRSAGRDVAIGDRTLALAPDIHHDLAEREAEDLNGGGELLGNFDYSDIGELGPWVQSARELWRATHRQKMAALASRCETDGRIAQALELAERLVIDDPAAEHAHRRLMRLHYLRGDRAAALAAFARCRVVLQRELSVAPGQETLDLASTIERSGVLPPATSAPPPVTVLRPPRLIGRESEWRAIEEAWQRQRAVLLIGEPGIGKSRLLADVAVAHAAALTVSARPGDSSVPYSVLSRLLRALLQRHGAPSPGWPLEELARLLPELGTQAAGPLQALRLRRAVAVVLTEWVQRGLGAMLIDDVQFADEASLEWLLATLSQGDELGVRFLLAVRASEKPAALQRWLSDHDETALMQLSLLPLGTPAIAQLLESLDIPGLDSWVWAEPLARHTGGNPMFILETLLSLLPNERGALTRSPGAVMPMPASVGQLIERRLSQLSPAALRLAQLAALAGLDFSAPLAAKILGVHLLDLSTSWRELETAQVVRDGAFAHDLIFEAARRSVPEVIAAAMHRDIARAAQALDVPAARIAQHWWRAGAWAEAAPHFDRAATVAFAASRRDEELRHLERAAECMEYAQNREAVFKLRLRAVEPALVVEAMPQVTARVDALLAAAATDSERLDVLLAKAKLAITAGDYTGGTTSAQPALALARQCCDPLREQMAARLLGVGLAVTGEVAAGLALLDEQVAAVAVSGDERHQHDFFSDYGYVLHVADRRHEAVAATRRAIGLAERLGDYNELMINLGNLAKHLALLGQPEPALEAARRAGALRERLGEAEGLTQAISQLDVGVLSYVAGRYGDAIEFMEAALPQFHRCGSGAATWICTTENILAVAWLALGQTARARQALTPLTGNVASSITVRRQVVACRAEQITGPVAVEKLREALSLFGGSGESQQRLLTQLALAAALPPDEGLALCAVVHADASEREQDAIALHALIRQADAMRRLGTPEQAAVIAHAATTQATHCSPGDMTCAEFWWLAYQVFDAAADVAAAHAALRMAVDWIRKHALPNVPEAFRDSFLNRNPINRLVLTTADRLLPR